MKNKLEIGDKVTFTAFDDEREFKTEGVVSSIHQDGSIEVQTIDGLEVYLLENDVDVIKVDTHQHIKNDGACLPEGYDWSQRMRIDQALTENSQVEALLEINKDLENRLAKLRNAFVEEMKKNKELEGVISSALTELDKVDNNHKITAGQDYYFPRQALNRARETLRVYPEIVK
ncbi:MAG: hypothetical protein ACK5N8_02165 [Alphaproteobacteria bacterium]